MNDAYFTIFMRVFDKGEINETIEILISVTGYIFMTQLVRFPKKTMGNVYIRPCRYVSEYPPLQSTDNIVDPVQYLTDLSDTMNTIVICAYFPNYSA